MQYSYEANGETYTIQLDKQADGSYFAKVGETSYHFSATPLPDGAWLLDMAGERQIIYTASAKEMRYVQVAGQQFTLEKVTGRKRRASAAKAAGDLKAEMPGQVIDLRVGLGDKVEAGQVLLVLEAMKMEIRLNAPYAGTIAKLLVKKGDVVDRGQLLVEVVTSNE